MLSQHSDNVLFKDNRQWENECIKQCQGINVIEIPGVHIGIANAPVVLTPGQHAHRDYEFMMPFDDNLVSISDKKHIMTEKNKITPFNSEQYHGPAEMVTLNKFLCISCEREYLGDIVSSVSGKKEIRFANESFLIDNNLKVLLGMLVEESIGKQTGTQFIKENIGNLILAGMIRQARSNLPGTTAYHRSREKRIERAAEFLREQYNCDFNLEQVAQIADLSPFHFLRVFKAQMGKTPYEFLLDVKIDRAKELLSIKDKNITEICLLCGFNNPSHFAAIFKRKAGVSPTEYRQIMLRINDLEIE